MISSKHLVQICLKKCSFPFSRDVSSQIPPCNDYDSSGKLAELCREQAATYRDLLEKYYESIYASAEDLLKKSQERQIQQLKKLLEKETSDVMRQLQQSRKNEVKQLALVHKDKDELERMKREVDSTLVEKGVAERVRLTTSHDKRKDELQKQHDAVKNSLSDQKAKIKSLIEKEKSKESTTCISSDNFLTLFNLIIPTSSISDNSIGNNSNSPKI